MKFMMKQFIKKFVVSEKPYKQNSRTAPVFLVPEKQDFDLQKNRLIQYLQLAQGEDRDSFEGRENPGFGKLTTTEWNNLYYKHVNHHLEQFGA